MLIIERRSNRVPFQEIATELGVTPQRVHQIWRRALDRAPVARIAEHRAAELELIEVAVRELLNLARRPRAGIRSRVEAWNSIKGWSEHKAKLLGLNAPTRTQVSMADIDLNMIDDEVERLIKMLDLTDEEVDQL